MNAPVSVAKRLIVAIDTADQFRADELIRDVAPHCGLIKLGLEFFTAHGPAAVKNLNVPVFLDLKLHDIPNTVAGAVRALSPLGVNMLSLHAAGGAAMITAAREAAEAAKYPTAQTRPALLAVTVLTSLDSRALQDIGIAAGTTRQVLRLARLALEAGADGLVCSAHEVPMLRDAFGELPILVVPGIRPAGSGHGDQARVMTPLEAVEAGASYIVVGRPVTQAPRPGDEAAKIAASVLLSSVVKLS